MACSCCSRLLPALFSPHHANLPLATPLTNIHTNLHPTHTNPTGNCLYSVPTSLTQLVHLEDLNISGNSLSTFPEGLGALTALNKLSLHGNRLTAVPADGWQCLQKLDEVCLQGNQLTAVPDSLAQLGVRFCGGDVRGGREGGWWAVSRVQMQSAWQQQVSAQVLTSLTYDAVQCLLCCLACQQPATL